MKSLHRCRDAGNAKTANHTPLTCPAACRAHDERNVQMKRLRARVRRGELRREEGAATAEYAIATMAAVGFAGLLVAILRSDEVRGMLTELVHRALTFAG